MNRRGFLASLLSLPLLKKWVARVPRLDGTSGYIEVADDSLLGPDDRFTLEFWSRPILERYSPYRAEVLKDEPAFFWTGAVTTEWDETRKEWINVAVSLDSIGTPHAAGAHMGEAR